VRLILLSPIVTAIITIATVAAGDSTGDPTVVAVDEVQFLEQLGRVDPRFERLVADTETARAEVIAAGIRAEPQIAIDREEVFAGGGLATNYARLTVPLDMSGRRGRRLAAARSSVDAVLAAGERVRIEIVVESMRIFEESAYARRYVEALRAERDALVRLVEVVRKRASAGASSGYDLQRFEHELSIYDDLIMSAETRLLEARTQLAGLLGWPRELVDAATPFDLPAPPPPLATLAATVLDGRGDYRAARLRGESAAQLVRAADRGWIPVLGLSAGAMFQDVGTETAFGYTAGVSFSLPVFDRGRAAKARARGEARAAIADARLIETRISAVLRAKHATVVRRIAQSEQLATTQLARIDSLLRAAETAYREGESGVVELLDAYQTARDTRLRDLELRREARLAALDLWLVLGRRP
jgi:cobalt-zinc-cadmium efflux system outer membrane protein